MPAAVVPLLLLLLLLALAAAATPSAVAAAKSGLYGLTLVHNSPVKEGFFSMDLTSGNLTLIGDSITQEAATGDLRAIDKKRSIYYFLGDTHAGATLVGIDMSSGSVACSSTVPLQEIGFVGIGQTLEMDHKRDRLVLAGMITNSSGGHAHQILTASLAGGIAARGPGPAPAACASFTKAGTFGIAADVPMLHSSAYAEETQTLFVTVSPNKTAFALAVIDLGSKTLTSVDLEGSPAVDELNGMSWDPDSARVIGLMQNMGAKGTSDTGARSGNGHGVNLMSLDPTTAKWTVRAVVVTSWLRSLLALAHGLTGRCVVVECERAGSSTDQHGPAELGHRRQRRGRT